MSDNRRFRNAARPRPRLDVYSFNLIHLWNVSNSLNWMQLRRTISERIGKVKFVETFEGWTNNKKIGHIILEFEDSKALDKFIDAIKNDNFLEAGVEWDQIKNRRTFFQKVLETTGVDLLSSRGVPPSGAPVKNPRSQMLSDDSLQPQGPMVPPFDSNPSIGGGPQFDARSWRTSRSRFNRYQPYGQFGTSIDASLKSKPFGAFGEFGPPAQSQQSIFPNPYDQASSGHFMNGGNATPSGFFGGNYSGGFNPPSTTFFF